MGSKVKSGTADMGLLMKALAGHIYWVDVPNQRKYLFAPVKVIGSRSRSQGQKIEFLPAVLFEMQISLNF